MIDFELEIEYKGQVLTLPVKLQLVGYIYKFTADVNKTEMIFELDDGGEFRAIQSNPDAKAVDSELLRLIADKLQQLRD